MANLLEYALMCSAAYEDDAQGNLMDLGGVVWSIQAGVGQTASNGFRGRVFSLGSECIVAFSGTETKEDRGGKEQWKDLVADARLMTDMPRQTSSAYSFYLEVTNSIKDSENITICGHSLGGALAQHIGYWTKTKFVTFNAPGVHGGILSTRACVLHSGQKAKRTWDAWLNPKTANGKNYRTYWDPVSLIGIGFHYPPGSLTRLPYDTSTGGKAHSITTVIQVLKDHSEWGNRNPFAMQVDGCLRAHTK